MKKNANAKVTIKEKIEGGMMRNGNSRKTEEQKKGAGGGLEEGRKLLQGEQNVLRPAPLTLMTTLPPHKQDKNLSTINSKRGLA